MAVHVTIEVSASVDDVWADLSRIESHQEWMTDAEQIEFASEQRSGVGTAIEVTTKVGPFRTVDRMTFTEWEPRRRMAVEHRGLVRGRGAFVLEAIDRGRTRFSWSEDLTFPWYFGGRIGAWFAQPVLRRIWRNNLRRFRDRFSGP